MGSRVLIIGGTGFIGRQLLDACLALGHEMTLLNRGHRPDPSVEGVAHIVADRRDHVPAALAAGWDVVVDTCAYTADDMRLCLKIATRRYVLLSSCGVYRAADTAQIADEHTRVDPEGPARGKLDCERATTDMPWTTLIVRLGAVTGPGDPSGRLTYWLERCLQGGDVLVPADPGQPVQLVDVRDVAAFLASTVESKLSGVVNVAGPVTPFEDLLRLVVTATRSASRLRWMPENAVLDQGVRPWREVPLWLPKGHPYRPHMRTGTARARLAGFAPRPFALTVDDTTRWFRANRTWHPEWLPFAREQAILAGAG